MTGGVSTVSVPVAGLVSPYTFEDVDFAADGNNALATAYFSDNQGCSNEVMMPEVNSCSPCEITDLVFTVLNCNNQGTGDISDDVFTLNITVNFFNPPGTGNLELGGSLVASVPVGDLAGNSHTFVFTGQFANGTIYNIAAAFS